MMRPLFTVVVLVLVAACGVDDRDDREQPTDPSPASSSERTTKSGDVPADQTTAPSASSSNPPSPVEGGAATATPSSLKDNRDRLIDTLVTQKNAADRCGLWASLTPTQRGVFLTITDLLGKRSYLTNGSGTGSAGRVTEDDVVMALDHVTKVYEIRDSNGDNGGGNNNRIWLQVDDTLIAALRSPNSALPEWAASSDLAGPHSPFDADSETVDGQPRGQAHFWSADSKSKAIGRPGVEDINDPHVVEIDIDYDLFHNSNPEGTYFPNGKGIDHYAKVWTSKGATGSPEFNYVPTSCPN